MSVSKILAVTAALGLAATSAFAGEGKDHKEMALDVPS